MNPRPLKIVVLVSGRGSNLQAVIDAWQAGHLAVELKRVISNRPGVQALERAHDAGIATSTLDHRQFDNREEYDSKLADLIDAEDPDLIVLAGFMRILSDRFVNRYLGKMINLHPSLLPKYPGLNTHQRALDNQDGEAGASLHFVTPVLDSGPLILQARVPVQPGDTAETLAQRILPLEHKMLVRALELFGNGRLQWQNGKAIFDDKPLAKPLPLDT